MEVLYITKEVEEKSHLFGIKKQNKWTQSGDSSSGV